MDEKQAMTHKILSGCMKVMIAHPEEKLRNVVPAVQEFLERTRHYDRLERIEYHCRIEELFKQVAERKDVPLPMWSREEGIRNVARAMAHLSGDTVSQLTLLSIKKAPDQ